MSFSRLRSLDSLRAPGPLGQLHHLTDVETEVRRAVVVSGMVAAGTKPACPPPTPDLGLFFSESHLPRKREKTVPREGSELRGAFREELSAAAAAEKTVSFPS